MCDTPETKPLKIAKGSIGSMRVREVVFGSGQYLEDSRELRRQTLLYTCENKGKQVKGTAEEEQRNFSSYNIQYA